MRSLALSACLAVALLAGCTSGPSSSPAAGDAIAGGAAGAPFVEEWDGATWGHLCADDPVQGGCFGQHTWEDGADEHRLAVREGAATGSLEVTWQAADPRYEELRVHASRSGVGEPVVAAGPSPLRLDLAPLLAEGQGSIVVTAHVASLEELPVSAHDVQWYHAVATLA